MEEHIEGLHNETVSLRDFIDHQIAGLKEYFNERFRLIEKETELARILIKDKMSEDNQIRQQLREQNEEFVKQTAEMIDRREHKLAMDRIESLEKSRANLAGKASQNSVYLGWLFAAIGILIAILSYLRD